MNPLLKGQRTSEHRKQLREWLTCLVDVELQTVVSGEKVSDENGEPLYDDPIPDVPCFVNESRARLSDTHQEVQTLDVDVIFDRNQNIEINTRLTNARNLRLEAIFAKAVVVGPSPVRHPYHATLVKGFTCVLG